MCNCQNHCRDWRETQGGKLPPSEHAPSCEDYKLLPFSKLSCSEGSFIMPQDEAAVFLHQNDEGEEYTETTVMMTQDQFDNLKEFPGF